MAEKKIVLLCTEEDREALQEIEQHLRAAGIRVTEEEDAGRKALVLAVLSRHFYADSARTQKLLSLLGEGAENVLPLQLDTSPIPDTIKNAVYARNIISAEGRDAAQVAERIKTALPGKKNRFPLILSAAGLVLLAVIVFLLLRPAKEPEPVEEPEEIVAAQEAEIPVPLPAGLTQEDLNEIRCVTIIGEHFSTFRKQDQQPRDDGSTQWRDMLYDLGSDAEHDGGAYDWFWNEDGTQASLTAYDLRFLSLMPNLEELHMALVDVEQAPDLKELEHLGVIWAFECELGDLTWIAESAASKLQIRSHADYAPLSESEALRVAILDSYGDTPTDFARFSPPNLQEFDLICRDMDSVDLSGLAACEKLEKVRLSCPAEDLSFLEGKSRLTELKLTHMDRLRNISALRSLTALRELFIENCDQIVDYSPVEGCAALESFNLNIEGDERLTDVSFLGNLKKLRSISLGGVALDDLEFLRTLARYRVSLDHFGFWGSIADYSGLSAIIQFGSLSLDPENGPALDEILPYLEGAVIQDLALRRFSEVDLAALPQVKVRLELDRCGISDLSTMPEDWQAQRLSLNKCQSLRSLDGLQNQDKLIDLEIYGCPRLSDWSALEGKNIGSFAVTGGFTLPDFSTFHAGVVRLDSVEEISDLHFLDGMDAEKPCSFELTGLDGVNNLQPLERFHGSYLAVSPQLAEQAQDLVSAGNFREFRIEYPQGGWEQEDMAISLLSLEELDTLPPALLRHVEKVCLVGDTVVDVSEGEIDEDWENNRPVLLYRRWGSEEEVPIEYGPGVPDILERLGKLIGLKRLLLYAQPLTSLDGIQNFGGLEELEIAFCRDLADASAAFACPNLHSIRIDNCRLSSIQGVQNLRELDSLNINGTQVSDLSPLAECDFSAARERGGLSLFINKLPAEDLSVLARLPLYRLDSNDLEAARYIPLLEEVPLRYLYAAGSFTGRGTADDNELFAQFVQAHPQLKELGIPWNQGITDLTPLLELEELELVRISHDMLQAISSLEGQEYRFRLEIED